MRARSGFAALLAAAALTACTIGGPGQSQDLTVTDDFGICGYVGTLAKFPEPAPTDGPAMRRWSAGLESLAVHLRPDWAPDGHPVPKAVVADIQVLKIDARQFDSAVRAAGNDQGKLRDAFAGLATPDFTSATSAIDSWVRLNCAGG